MKFHVLMSIAMLCAAPALANEETLEARYLGMSEDEIAADIRVQAEANLVTIDEAVKSGELSLGEAEVYRQSNANAVAQTQRKGFGRRFLGVLGKIGKASGKGALFVVKGVGYAGEAVALSFITPVPLAYGFTVGVIAGSQADPSQNNALHWAGVAGGIGGLYAADPLVNAIPAVGTVFLGSIGILAANEFIVCTIADGSDYCKNVRKVYDAMTAGAAKAGRSGGGKVRRFFGKIGGIFR